MRKCLQKGAPCFRAAEHRTQRGDRLGGDDRDAAALPGEGKGFLVSGGIVLAHGCERLVFVADEQGRPEVSLRFRLHLNWSPQERLKPGVLEHYADSSGQRRVGTGRHVQSQHLARLDQLIEGR